MTSRQSLVRGLVAASLLGTLASPTIGLIVAHPTGPTAPHMTEPAIPLAPGSPMGDSAAAKDGWVDNFEHFAARHSPVADTLDKNVVVVAKAVPGPDAPAAGDLPESIEPKDALKAPLASTDAPVDDDGLLKTGSIKSQHVPLLPPVPGPDAFKMHKGDRLGVPPRSDPAHTMPGAADGTLAPHAALAPSKANAVMLPGKSSLLSAARGDKLKPVVVASAAMKPMDLAPDHPDALFQGPPMPADPTLDPDAPVLGYAEQMASAEAPFKSLFAVTPVARHSWLGTDTTAPAKAKAAKPSKVAHILHRHSRKHDG
jgi:hypothetical protein